MLGVLIISAELRADGSVKGDARYEKIKGRPGSYVELYEWNLFLSRDLGASLGERRRIGACSEYGGACTASYYQIEAPAGWYSMLLTQPIFYARPTVVTDIQIVDGQVRTVNPDLNPDYGCRHLADGAWSWDTTWYQTFMARGTSVIRIQWLLAGWHANRIAVSVHRDNGGAITSWPQVGPSKTGEVGYGDGWVGFRSGDIPLTPHQRYAIKLTGQGGTHPYDFAIRTRVEDGGGYALGQAYDSGGNPRNLDLVATVFTDNDGCVIPYIDMTPGNVEDLAGGTGTWGQTFRATSVALAAADCFVAGSGTWDVDAVFRIRQNGPGGAQVGPIKTGQSLYQAANSGIIGVSYAPGEVPLTPGNTYFIEMSPAPGSPAFEAYKFHSQSENGYAHGQAYKNGIAQSNVDLEMTIMEYKPWYTPAVVNPSFEDYGGLLEGWRVNALDGKGPDNPPHSNTNPYGPRTNFGDHFAGKITSWQGMNFSFGQIIEVGDFSPSSTRVEWALDAHVQLRSHSGTTEYPDNVHQHWEVGWMNNGSVPPAPDRCDQYSTLALIAGSFTGNDRKEFLPLSVGGSITGVTGLKYVALRVRLYNDSAREWSMSNIDNVSFTAVVPPPGPQLEVTPSIYTSACFGSSPPDGQLTVRNSGADTLNYALSDDAPWLALVPEQGALSAGQSRIVQIMYRMADLPPGAHHATITVESPDAWNSPINIPVEVVIETAPPDFDLDGDVDQEDFGRFQVCLTGAGVIQLDPVCQLRARLDSDEDVDPTDLEVFLRCMTAPNVIADCHCAD
ncbi:MAG: hypothetical protein AMXMBFR13_41690 [Phycisphaerae bacterium]